MIPPRTVVLYDEKYPVSGTPERKRNKGRCRELSVESKLDKARKKKEARDKTQLAKAKAEGRPCGRVRAQGWGGLGRKLSQASWAGKDI
jgi:hypothetical protein